MSQNINLKIGNNVFRNCMISIMKLMIPFTPHLARECLELLKCENPHKWPIIDTKKTVNKIKIAIQVNGKTRDIISVEKNTNEKQINELILKNSKTKKYIENKKVKKTIFVKDKILNYILDL